MSRAKSERNPHPSIEPVARGQVLDAQRASLAFQESRNRSSAQRGDSPCPAASPLCVSELPLRLRRGARPSSPANPHTLPRTESARSAPSSKTTGVRHSIVSPPEATAPHRTAQAGPTQTRDQAGPTSSLTRRPSIRSSLCPSGHIPTATITSLTMDYSIRCGTSQKPHPATSTRDQRTDAPWYPEPIPARSTGNVCPWLTWVLQWLIFAIVLGCSPTGMCFGAPPL